MFQLEDMLGVIDNPKISQQIADFCQMLPIPFQDDHNLESFARLQFKDGQTNAIASLPSKYAMFGANEIFKEVIGGKTGEKIKEYFKDVELMEGPLTSEIREMVRSSIMTPCNVMHKSVMKLLLLVSSSEINDKM